MKQPDDETTRYNARLNAELDKLKKYREAVEQEYATLTASGQAEEAQAKRVFSDNIADVAQTILNIATGRNTEASPGTVLKAAMYVYDRVVINDDDPRKSEMEKLLTRLSTDPAPVTPPESNID